VDYQRENLSQVLAKLRRKIKRFRESDARVGEQNTKATLIEPLLAALGWNIEEPEEVHREYRKQSQDSPVDYALCMVRTPCLFVEAKSLEKNLEDRKQAAQVLGYATVVGVEWCVLTNGDEYRLYNAHAAVDVQEKLFRRITISDGSTQNFIEDTLDLLSKPRLMEKRLTLLWAAHHVDRQVKSAMETLWSRPDPGFVRLIRRNAKGLAPSDIKASLQRSRIKVDFPVESIELLGGKKQADAGRKKRGRKDGRSAHGFPTRREIEIPLLQEILDRGGSIETRMHLEDVVHALASKFSLTPQQTSPLTRRGGSTIWKNTIRWVRQALINKGDLDGSERGIWKVTTQGRVRAGKGAKNRIRLVDRK